MGIEIIPIRIKQEILPNDNLATIITKNSKLEDNDVLVISQKIVSKQEGRIIELSSIIPSILSVGIASEYGKDPKIIEAILSESNKIVRMEDEVLIVETKHGFICANAGVDESNVQEGYITLLPKDPDESAKKLRDDINKKTGKRIAVIISDTFGRPFRNGQTDNAIGIAGIESITDYARMKDSFGRILRVTAIAVADELCSAAELVKGKSLNCPAAIIRNYKFKDKDDKIVNLLRPKENDLFR